MPPEQPSRLAAECGQALVAAMPTPDWPALREEAVGMLHDAGPALEGVLVPELDVNARMLLGAAPEHVAVLTDMLAARWRENLVRVLAVNPAADEALRRLVERIGGTAPTARPAGKTMTNIAKDNSTLFAVMDGNIIQHHHAKPGRGDQAGSNQTAADESA